MENYNFPGVQVVISRALTRFYYIRKTAAPPVGHVFQQTGTIFKFSRAIIRMNVLTKKTSPPPGGHLYEHWTTNVTPRVLTSFFYYETNVLTKLHEDWTKNVTSRVFTCFHYLHIEKTAPTPGGHFHEDWAKIVTSRVFTIKTAPPPGSHVFQRTGTIFELNQHIIKTNISTKLHEDWASNVTSTVFTSFELSRDIIGTNVLTKFHEDRTINVASRVFTRQNVDDGRTTDGRQKAIPKAHHEHIVLSIVSKLGGSSHNVASGQEERHKLGNTHTHTHKFKLHASSH
ncbi:hypothetical protein DPMN_035794 [Dreissena polymorpha]|uniref:Uncharacterized protein n=1 Tax=Dreissena polymorpha TaxID=45954 RepID=A0A9D4MCI0_DREPO|nr:hypothetical protein DPMN_035794 [Dreissena polymorpha]